MRSLYTIFWLNIGRGAVIVVGLLLVIIIGGGGSPTYAQVCGDGTCELSENSLNCFEDCPPVCGNGILELGEECEPPNTAVCDASCLETVFCGNGTCEPGDGEDSVSCPIDCPPVCGNGILELGEDCDDNNTADGDGCSSTCSAEDPDGDAILDPPDNCPDVYNPFQTDADFDTFGDACDCAPGDPLLWTNPSEVQGVRLTHDPLTGNTTITWNPPVELGATSVVYDTISSTNPADFITNAITVCVESDDGTDEVAGIEPTPFRPVEFIQIRAENPCPSPFNIGSLGTDTDGLSRVGRSCP